MPTPITTGPRDAAPRRRIRTSALRPLAASMAGIVVAATWPAAADADPGDSGTSVLNTVGIGNNGPVSTALASVGHSICPMLVQPGATSASVASQLAGNTGLSPNIAAFVTGMAIQMECPGVMTSLANGDLPFPLQAPGGNPTPPLPFAPPGAAPALPNPLQMPAR